MTNGTGTLSITAVAYDTLGNAVTNITTYGDLTAVSSAVYDSHRRAVSRTDAAGNTVETGYDDLGQTLSLSGATYPVYYAYDTAGWRTELNTTRNGATWDKTRFLHDTVTGLLTNKVHADDSNVSYTYSPSGKSARMTWARGAFKDNLWDGLSQLVGTYYSDATPAITYARNDFGTVTNVADTAGLTYEYTVNARQTVTNETVMSCASTNTLTRLLDGYNRPAGIRLGSDYALFYGRDSEGRISVISNADFIALYAYTNDYVSGCTLALSNGNTLARSIIRDPHRPWLVTSVTNLFNDEVISFWSYTYDINGRIVQRNADSFGYNARSELTSALLYTNAYGYVIDGIGNRLVSTCNGDETTYTANSLNQYTAVNAVARACDEDGNLFSFGPWGFAWDAENRLTSVTSNGVPILSNAYDYRHRRVRKSTSTAVRNMVYDGWNLIQENVTRTNGPSSVSHNYWGLDLSGSLQGVGGVGGLLAVNIDGQLYFPLYDNNGNIAEYVDTLGSIRAHYEYSPFGEIIAQSGDLATTFPHRFSTKYFDAETRSYYYGYRHYSPQLGCWLTKDPLGEDGGLNLHGFVGNTPVNLIDAVGLKIAITTDKRFDSSSIPSTYQGSGRGGIEIINKIRLSCSRCIFHADGKYTKTMRVLGASDDRWNLRLSQYDTKWGKPRSNAREREATISHENDHWKAWQPWERFLNDMNALDGKKLNSCSDFLDQFGRQAAELERLIRIRSHLFDSSPWNQGGMNND